MRNLKSIGEDWRELESRLTKEQLSDGESCFYCGALKILSDLLEHNGFTPDDLQAFHSEILAKLAHGPDRI